MSIYLKNKAKQLALAGFALVFVALLCLASAAGADLEGAPIKRVETFTLKNGIRVLILERRFSPTVSFYIRFRAGAVDESEGKTGLAHLLEHMMFKGTKTIGGINPVREEKLLREIARTGEALDRERTTGDRKDGQRIEALEKKLAGLQKEHRRWYRSNEIDRLYAEAGAVNINASTGQDMITYHVSLPANKAELWARIEADRLANHVLREFYQEREVVIQERRQRTDANPDGLLFERFAATAFMAHPYRRPIIGWPDDIAHLGMEDVKSFHRLAKAPGNMVIAIVGDVRVKEMRRLLDRYFGVLPGQPATLPRVTTEPPSLGEKRVTVHFDAGERLIMGFHKPPPPQREDYVFDVIEALLSRDRSSRFYRRLVETQGLAESVQAANGLPGNRYPNLFCVFATARHPHKIDELAAAVEKIIDELAVEPTPTAELEKVKNQLQADLIRRQDSNEGLASLLSYYECLLGDYRYLDHYGAQIATVTPEEIMATARKYLRRDNRTMAIMTKDR
ncbi:MAG: pitrilysin family protein [Pseudomonadota bacterium]|nr:pitrilysin family protein [Pseudomonadota bacterium]